VTLGNYRSAPVCGSLLARDERLVSGFVSTNCGLRGRSISATVVLVYGEDVELGVGERYEDEQAALFPELSELYREAVVLARRLDEAQQAAVEASGRDASERVRVVLTPAGRIGEVEVGVDWRSVLGVDGLVSAVLAAYRKAGNRRVETWAAEIARTETDTAEISPVAVSLPVNGAAIGRTGGPGPADPPSPARDNPARPAALSSTDEPSAPWSNGASAAKAASPTSNADPAGTAPS
jgi:hypothetical protein